MRSLLLVAGLNLLAGPAAAEPRTISLPLNISLKEDYQAGYPPIARASIAQFTAPIGGSSLIIVDAGLIHASVVGFPYVSGALPARPRFQRLPAAASSVAEVLSRLPASSRATGGVPLEALQLGRVLFDSGVRPRAVALDTNALSRLIEGPDMPYLRELVEARGVRLQLSRQAVQEALNYDAIPFAAGQKRHEGLQRLIEHDKLFVSGTSQMTERMRAEFNELAELLVPHLSVEDARVAADAIVKRVPLLSFDGRMARALSAALRNRAVSSFLRLHGYPTDAKDILLLP